MQTSQKVLKESKDNFKIYKSISSFCLHGNEILVERPLISIVIPTYKRPQLLKVAIKTALEQKNPNCNYEVIVVDNEPRYTPNVETETELMVKTFDNNKLIYYQNESNIGMVGNWNRCIELARGEWVSFLHDDDLLKLDYLHKVTSLLKRKPNIGALIASSEVFGSAALEINKQHKSKKIIDKIIKPFQKNKLMKISAFENCVWNTNLYGPPTCGTIFKKEYVLKEKGFDEQSYPSADWLFLFQFNQNYKVYRSLETLGYYRISDNESLNPQTLKSFITDCIDFREENYKFNIITKVMYKLFKHEQLAFNLAWIRSLDKRSQINSKEMYNILRYKQRPLRFLVFRRLLTCYRILKKSSAILWG